MADVERKKGSTYPAFKGYAFDEAGSLPVADADKLEVRFKGAGKFITGEAKAIDPPEEYAPGKFWNYEYLPEAEDVATIGADYQHELWIYWDEGSSPPRIQKLPEHLTENPTLAIVQDLVE